MPSVRQIGSTPKRALWVSMNIAASPGRVELLREKGARRLQDLVRAPQLTILTLELREPLALGTRQPIATRARVRLGLTDPQPQRLAMHAEITRDMPDRPAALKDQPDTAFSKFLGVLACRWHRGSVPSSQDRSSWLGSLHRTRDGSSFLTAALLLVGAVRAALCREPRARRALRAAPPRHRDRQGEIRRRATYTKSIPARPAAHPVAMASSSGVTRSRTPALISPPPTAVTSAATVCTSYHSPLRPRHSLERVPG
jgi:hypothetical protein